MIRAVQGVVLCAVATLIACGGEKATPVPSRLPEPAVGLRVHNERLDAVTVVIAGLPDANVAGCSTRVVPYPNQPSQVVFRTAAAGVIYDNSTPPPLGVGVEAFTNADVTEMAPVQNARGGPFHSAECIGRESSGSPAP